MEPQCADTRTGAARAIPDAEWQARVELAALYRALHAYGMTDLVYNHITARVPGEPEHILINPFGMLLQVWHGRNPYEGPRDVQVALLA